MASSTASLRRRQIAPVARGVGHENKLSETQVPSSSEPLNPKPVSNSYNYSNGGPHIIIWRNGLPTELGSKE